ncbi:MAG: sulfite exporter TauE/SafE family protein [Clostridia bacterium]
MKKRKQKNKNKKIWQNKTMMKKIVIGIIAGFISGLFASGGGMILVPAFLYFLKLEDKKARATSVFCILPMVITSSIFYFKNQYLNWDIGIKCAIGGIIGGILGAKLLNKVKPKYMKLAFTVFLIYVSVRMIFF